MPKMSIDKTRIPRPKRWPRRPALQVRAGSRPIQRLSGKPKGDLPLRAVLGAVTGSAAHQLFVAVRDVARQGADLKTIVADLADGGDLGGGAG